MKIKSKFFRVAVEGQTTDGRNISREDIEAMASAYEPAAYGARTWIEHMRSFMPRVKEQPEGWEDAGTFSATGDVLALSTEEITEGMLKGKLALLAQVETNEYGTKLHQTGDKQYWSIEMDTDFSDTDSAYLVGLAHTDSPASLGTEIMKFSAGATENPLAARKQKATNLFSCAEFAELDWEEEAPQKANLFSRISEIFSKQKRQADSQYDDAAAAIEVIAEEVVELSARIPASTERQEYATLEAFKALKDELAEATKNHADLVTQLEKQPNSNYTQRPPSNGGDKQLADC